MLILPTESEKKLLDSLAVEHLELSCHSVKLYITKPEEGGSDKLYSEPRDKWSYDIYEVVGYIRKYDKSEIAGESGRVTELSNVFYVARKTLDDLGIQIKVGDIVEAWGLFYDVVKVEPYGFKSDENFYTHVKCELIRRTRYLPEKKL